MSKEYGLSDSGHTPFVSDHSTQTQILFTGCVAPSKFFHGLSDMAGSGVFQFLAASIAIKDAHRFHVILLCSVHVVLPVSDHHDLRRVREATAFHNIADHIALVDSGLIHVRATHHLEIFRQAEMLYDLYGILLWLEVAT